MGAAANTVKIRHTFSENARSMKLVNGDMNNAVEIIKSIA